MNKQKRLIVSWDTYSWIHALAGFIAKDPISYEIIIVMKDDETPIHWTNAFCKDAIYAQRVHDLRCVGRQLGIRKLSNLLYDNNTLHLDNITAKLQMHLVLAGIREVYFQYNTVLENIFRAINKKLDLEMYSYDGLPVGVEKIIYLNNDEVLKKRSLLKWMIAMPHYQLDYDDKEYLYRI